MEDMPDTPREPEELLLADEDGNELAFRLLDAADYEGGHFLLLQDPEDENYVVILQETAVSAEEAAYAEPEDEALLEALFALFRERNAGRLELDEDEDE